MLFFTVGFLRQSSRHGHTSRTWGWPSSSGTWPWRQPKRERWPARINGATSPRSKLACTVKRWVFMVILERRDSDHDFFVMLEEALPICRSVSKSGFHYEPWWLRRQVHWEPTWTLGRGFLAMCVRPHLDPEQETQSLRDTHFFIKISNPK